MKNIKRIIKKMIFKIKKHRFCKLNHYNCPECIHNKFIFDEDGVFRGIRCQFGRRVKERFLLDEKVLNEPQGTE